MDKEDAEKIKTKSTTIEDYTQPTTVEECTQMIRYCEQTPGCWDARQYYVILQHKIASNVRSCNRI